MDGKQVMSYVRSLYNLDSKENPTAEQLNYALSLLSPVNYALRNHTAKGHPITFDIPNYDYSKAVGHRPWQKEILKASTDVDNKEVTIAKSRQLGLSEVGVETMMYLADVYSFDALKILYAFPKNMWGFSK